MKVVIDDRPRCQAIGFYHEDHVPCDLSEGHKGRHEWTLPMSFSTYVWTDNKRSVRPL